MNSAQTVFLSATSNKTMEMFGEDRARSFVSQIHYNMKAVLTVVSKIVKELKSWLGSINAITPVVLSLHWG